VSNPGDVIPNRASGWKRVGLRGWPSRWLAAGTLLALVGLWILVLTMGFGSASHQRQSTFLASRASGNALSAMLAEEAALRGFEATGARQYLGPITAGQRRVVRNEEAARSDVGSDSALVAKANAQLALAAQWRTLADAEIDSANPRAFALAHGSAAARARVVQRFQAANGRFETLLLLDRSHIQSTSRENAILIAVIFSLLVLLIAVGVLHGLGRADARMRALIDSSPDLITVVDAHNRILYVSPAVARMLGYEADAPVGTQIAHLLHPDDALQMAKCLRTAGGTTGAGRPLECRWRHADGSLRWLETVCNNLLADPKVAGIVLNSRDVTERHQLSEQLRRRAFHDPLTGLANRAKFEERLEQAVGRVDPALAVLFLDVDNFKMINDSLGHSAGDHVLGEIAHRLRGCVRVGDTVARMGGDEFAVLVVGLDSGVRAPRIAERILRELAMPLELDQRAITMSASIGIACGGSATTAQEILRDSDLALYAAKRAGKGQAQLYRPSMHAAALEQLELEADLRLALERDELLLHYQPLFRLDTGELAGYEALARWEHPSRGLLLPDMFIGLAERTGLIVPLTRWALHTACEQTAEWQRRVQQELEVGVNLSFVNLKDRTILGDVASALSASGISPEALVLEVTEGNLMRDQDKSRQILTELKRIGVRLALDDFGTGHSSLSRLSQLPFDILKIPRPFIERITHSDSNFALTQGIVDLGHRLGLAIVAEGIETPRQLARVRAIGCELGQGFHLATPASSASTNPAEDRSLRETIAPDPPPPADRPVPLKLVREGESVAQTGKDAVADGASAAG
jgi:diguanylate cyclase (GGDEF)-like protein/PAS domain S-box-containing protein